MEKNKSTIFDNIVQDFKFEVDALKTIFELCLNKTKDLLKNTAEFNKYIKEIFKDGIQKENIKNEKYKRVLGFIQGFILFYFNSAWGIGRGIVRKSLIDKTGKKLKIVLIGKRKLELNVGEYDENTIEYFSMAKKILWNKELTSKDSLSIRDIYEIKKIFYEKYNDLKHTQKQLLKMSQNPNDIVKVLGNIEENIMPVFIFLGCLPENKMEELFKCISSHLPSSYEDILPDGRKTAVSQYFLEKYKNISDYFEKIRVLMYLYSKSKHKIIEEIVKIKTRDFLLDLFNKDKETKETVIKTILDTVENQFNPKIQLMGFFIKMI